MPSKMNVTHFSRKESVRSSLVVSAGVSALSSELFRIVCGSDIVRTVKTRRQSSCSKQENSLKAVAYKTDVKPNFSLTCFHKGLSPRNVRVVDNEVTATV